MSFLTNVMTQAFIASDYLPYFWVGLYYDGYDPYQAIDSGAEVYGRGYARQLVYWEVTSDSGGAFTSTGQLAATSPVSFYNLPEGVVGGYFVIQDLEFYPLYAVPFTAPVSVGTGDGLTIAATDLVINVEIS